MKTAEERARDQAAFCKSKDVIARTYPPGRLVAIVADEWLPMPRVLKTWRPNSRRKVSTRGMR